MKDLTGESAGSSLAGIPVPRRPRGWAFRPIALACIALATVSLIGCKGGPCGGSPCGGGSGLFSGFKSGIQSASETVRSTTTRMFHHKSRATGGDCCGGGSAGVVEGMPVEGSVISGSGGMIPGPVPSSPVNENAPTILEPLPGSGSGTKSKSSSVPSTLKDSGIKQSAIGRNRTLQSEYPGRGDDLARTALTPSADRSAGGARGGQPTSNLLDNVPPVDLNEEIPRRAKASSVPIEAELIKLPVADASVSETNKEKDSEFPSIRAGIDSAIAPGFQRFASVKPGINGGSLPSTTGLDLLKERGTKTLLDLRDANDVDIAFVEQVKSRGLRHISLPVDVNRLDTTTVARFGEEVSRSTGQPVYFFDRDGTRAGMIWYVHRLTSDKVDAQLASHEAEELGLSDKTVWVAAAKYLDTVKASTPIPAATKLKLPVTKAEKTSAKDRSVPRRGPAAVILTGLSAPLVEWSNAAITNLQTKSASPVVSAQ